MSMTEKEAIEIIKNTPLLRYEGQCGLHSDLGDAMRMAVEALEKQTMVNEILHELKEYKNLEEQGLLLRLPCKVGDKVWFIREISVKRELIETEVEKVISKKGRIYIQLSCNSFYETSCNSIGKTVFFSRAEAEAALENMSK